MLDMAERIRRRNPELAGERARGQRLLAQSVRNLFPGRLPLGHIGG
jgi:hypothetical protein